MEIRNITIIAHVDHGKTTLVDGLLELNMDKSRKALAERAMDSMDLERERGITIRAKNASIEYAGGRINIIDTPGHADFGGEVERVLTMADAPLLLVDAVEGPMPQTRFVLEKSLRLGHKPILVINKIDREFADPDAVLEKVFDLFDELGATSEQMDFPVVYASAKNRFASMDLERAGKEDTDLTAILDLVLKHVPSVPPGAASEPFQFQAMNLDYDEYIGRLAIGRVFRGTLKRLDQVALLSSTTGKKTVHKISALYGFRGMERVALETAQAGDIIALAGIDDLGIGDTVSSVEHQEARPPIRVDEPTVSMYFLVNDSPFAGKEGKFVTTRQIRERLLRETMTNVALRVQEDPESKDRFKVEGRGDLHLGILIETMRREGYELQVSRPEVILKKEGTQTQEPYEIVVIDLPEEYSGAVISELNRRRGDMQSMNTSGHGIVRLEYIVPTRGLISFRTHLITESRGSAAFTSRFLKYGPHAGPIPGRRNGALVATESGVSVAFALFSIQERGQLFIEAGVQVYGGMVIGECSRESDLDVNPCREKKLTNVRASGSDEAVRLTPRRVMGLDRALEFIDDDELVEVTPLSARIRKKYLDPHERKRRAKQLVASP